MRGGRAALIAAAACYCTAGRRGGRDERSDTRLSMPNKPSPMNSSGSGFKAQNPLNEPTRMTAAPAPADAAVNWTEQVDPSSGRTYYYNHATQQSSWEPPAGFTAPRPDLAAAGAVSVKSIDPQQNLL